MGKYTYRRVSRIIIVAIVLVLLFFDAGNSYAADSQSKNEYDLYLVTSNSNLRATPSANGNWVGVVHIGDIVLVTDSDCGNNFYKILFGETEAYLFCGAMKKDEGITFDDYKAQFPELSFDLNGNVIDLGELYKKRRESIKNENISEDKSNSDDKSSTDNMDNEDDENQMETGKDEKEENDKKDEKDKNDKNDKKDGKDSLVSELNVKGKATTILKIRSMPSQNSDQIGGVPAGAEMIVIDEGENGYLHIKYEDTDGYVFAQCVIYDPSAEKVKNTNENKTDLESKEEIKEEANKKTTNQNTTEKIEKQSATEKPLNQNTTEKTEKQNTTEKTENQNAAGKTEKQNTTEKTAGQIIEEEKTGNITEKDESVENVAENSSQTIILNRPERVFDFSTYLVGSKANLRALPDNKSNIIATLSIGADVKVLGNTRDGYKMVQYNGMTGYILESSLVDKVDIQKIGGEPIIYKITAYCPCRICCGNYSPDVTGRESHTSTGTVPEQGRTIAVDPTVIPYGSKVYIDGYGTFIAEDCGGAVKGEHIDMYFDNHEDAVLFGVKRLYVVVLDK